MTNSELAPQAYAFEQVVREVFEKCHEALIGSTYDFYRYKFTYDGVEIIGEVCYGGETDYESFIIPYADLDDVDTFLVRRQSKLAEEACKKLAQKLADYDKKKAAVEQTEYQQYLKLKEKYELATLYVEKEKDRWE